jgi:menaquinone-9 beta-reductase
MGSLRESVESCDWQSPAEAAPREGWDVAIAGAGPSGSLAAYLLARLGHRVLLLDKADFPRDKICGDALIPDSLKALERAELLDDVRLLGHPVAAASVYSPSQTEVVVPGEYLTLKRRTLDALMAYRAAKAGVTFCRAAVEDAIAEPGGGCEMRVAGGGVFRARLGVLATGANVELLSRLKMVRRREPSAIAARQYITSTMQLDRLVVSYDRSITPGYAWIFPLGNNEYNVGCGVFYRKAHHRAVNLREMLNRFLAEFPLARQLVKCQTGATPLKGAPLRCSLVGSHVHGSGNILAIGESIGATFPLTGEGIGKAMETAELAADAIHSYLETGAQKHLRALSWRIRTELMPRYLGYEIGERWLTYPWLNDFIAWRVNRSALLQKVIRGIISETIDPRRLFSLSGILKSLWK